MGFCYWGERFIGGSADVVDTDTLVLTLLILDFNHFGKFLFFVILIKEKSHAMIEFFSFVFDKKKIEFSILVYDN